MEVEIKIEGSTNLVKVPVYVNDQGPFTFNLDTGASRTTLSSNLAESLGIQTYESSRNDARGIGGSVTTRFANIDSLAVGSLSFDGDEVYVLDLNSMLGECGARDGVLGHSTLQHCILSLSYHKRRFKLRRGNSSKEESELEFTWSPFDYIEDTHLVQIPVYVNHQGPFDFVIDTGAGSSVITPELAKVLSLQTQPVNGIARGIGGDVKLEFATLDHFSFGSYKQERMQVAVIDLGSVSPRGKLIEHGIIGYDILRQLELVIDYPRKRIAFNLEHSASPSQNT
ncbi:MAG: retroviral-like aspartic protease family protein [Candidatus Thorarchaeota archaeon]